MRNNQKGFTLVEGLLIVIALALVVGVGYYVMNSQEDKNSTSVSETVPQTKTKPTVSKKSTESDDALIIAAVKAYGDNTENLLVKVDTISGNNAKGTSAYSDGPGGSAFIAHNSDGKWSVIYQGQQLPGKDLGEQYSLPSGWYSTDY